MQGDWIKMRTDLYRDPKVIVMAGCLADSEGPLAVRVRHAMSRDMSVTQNVTRHAVVGALVSVWGIARHQGKRDGDNLVLSNVTIDVLDDIADMPGIGCAMAKVGWVTESRNGLVFPKFFAENNTDPLEKKRQQDAERKRRQRANMSRDASRDIQRDASRDCHVTVTHREEKSRVEKSRVEKRREEKSRGESPPETIQPPSPPEGEPPVGGDVAESTTAHEVIRQEWNLTPGVIQCQRISAGRRTALRARLKEPFWRDNWRAAMAKIAQSPGLQGQNDRSWRPDFEWFLRPDTITKLLEGRYDQWGVASGSGSGPPVRSRFETPAERMRRVGEKMLQEMDHGTGGEAVDDQVIDVAGRVLQPGDDGSSDGDLLPLPF